jgi:hypothetical protein
MERNNEIQNFLDNLSRNAFGRTSKQAQEAKICTYCGKSATEFKDEKSEREYKITGYCQACQDEVFDHFSGCLELNCANYEKVNGKSGCTINKDPDECEIFEGL